MQEKTLGWWITQLEKKEIRYDGKCVEEHAESILNTRSYQRIALSLIQVKPLNLQDGSKMKFPF